jgi:hypothetical protein
MAVIKPTLNLTSNASTATTDPGPLSIALALSATDSITISNVTSKIVTFTGTGNEQLIWDGSTLSGADTTTETLAMGGYMYFKNTSATADVYIGVDHDGGGASPTNIGAADQAEDGTATAAIRFGTLKAGEFAFIPFDGTLDLLGDASAAATLECWYFDR